MVYFYAKSFTYDNVRPFTINSELYSTIDVISKLDYPTSLTTTSKTESMGGTCKDSTAALTSGVICAIYIIIVTALMVSSSSVAFHVAVYKCVYKPKLMRSSTGIIGAGLADDADRCGDAIVVHDVIGEKIETSLEMKQNEAYSLYN